MEKSAGGHRAWPDCADLRRCNSRTALAPHAPDEVNPLMKYQAPSADYPLGTDQLGRCELSRLLYGARASLGLALPILILLGGIGLILGMMTACIGGWFDRVVTGISQVFIAFPTLIIAVAIIGVLGNGLQKYYLGGCHLHVGAVYAAYSHLCQNGTWAGLHCRREGVRLWNVAAYCSPFNSQYPSAVFGVFFNGRSFGHPHGFQLFVSRPWSAQRNG